MKNYLIVLVSLAGLAGLALLSPSTTAEPVEPPKRAEPTALFPLTIEEQRAMAEDAAVANQEAKQWQDSEVGPIEAPQRPELAADPQQMPAAGQN